jgi:hypothetical protein
MPKDRCIVQAECPLNAQIPGANEAWLRVLDAYQVRFLVLNLDAESDMVKYFRSLPGWLVDFEDEVSIIFARADVSTCAHQEVYIAA